jgi:hypothetical protein
VTSRWRELFEKSVLGQERARCLVQVAKVECEMASHSRAEARAVRELAANSGARLAGGGADRPQRDGAFRGRVTRTAADER